MSESVLLDLDNYKREQIQFKNEYSPVQPSPNYSDLSSENTYMMSSPSSVSRSPMSTCSSETSQTNNFQNLTINSFDDNNSSYSMDSSSNSSNAKIAVSQYHSFDVHGNPIRPKLVITEQPIDKFRFRYKSEMHGTHGSLMGRTSSKSRKKYPTVELRDFYGKAIIRCALYQTDRDEIKRSQHSHRLVVRNGDIDHDDPHDIEVSPEKGFNAVFQGMGIIHTAKKYIVEELYKKKVLEKQVESNRRLTPREEHHIKKLAEQEAKIMNLNQVCLGFQAFIVENDEWKQLCDPVYSNPINNMKSALTGELKISRLSAAVSSAAGGDDLILLVEKVGKKNIKVRFYETDDEDREIWEAYGIFTEVDVHHQYAIALRTPPYKNIDITEPVDVYIQLYRPSDHDRSESVSFKYKPRNYINSRKRQRVESNVNSFEIPTTVKSFPSNNNLNEIMDTVNSSDINKAIELLNLPNEQFGFDSETEKYLMENFSSYGMNGLETDAPNTVIQRGPGAPPLEYHGTHIKFYEILKEINSIYRSTEEKPTKQIRNDIEKKILESVINGENILHWALRKDNEFKTMANLFLIIYKLDLSDVLQSKNSNDETCLHIACVHNKPEYIRPLINLGADPNIPDSKGNTPLHVAIELSYEMCANKILEKTNYTIKSKELRIDLANHHGMTALHLAVRKKNLKIIKHLLENGASVKISESKNGYNALHIAVDEDAEEIVRYLLEKTTIKIDEQSKSGHTPLHIAIAKESSKIIQILIDHEADPNILNDQGCDDDNEDDDDKDEDSHDADHCDIDEFNCETKNNPEISNILEGLQSIFFKKESQDKCDIRHRVRSENDDEIVDDFNDDENNEHLNKPVEFDEDCLIGLCKIFNKQLRWKYLAHQLNFTEQTKLWESSSNPTKLLLKKIESDHSITIKKLINTFKCLNEIDAITEIDAMIARDNDNDTFM